MVILCPASARHAEWTENVAEYGVPVLMEKPFAGSLAEADRMIAAMAATGAPLAINWPLCWVPSHATAYRLVQEGLIGTVTDVHYCGGNRGPLYHGADKIELEPTPERKAQSWFYKRSEGGGSLLDYLGYGTTLGTWFMGNAKPIEVTAVTSGTPGLEVDEHSITIARYATGLSKFETRWGTFTDPWVRAEGDGRHHLQLRLRARAARADTPAPGGIRCPRGHPDRSAPESRAVFPPLPLHRHTGGRPVVCGDLAHRPADRGYGV